MYDETVIEFACLQQGHCQMKAQHEYGLLVKKRIAPIHMMIQQRNDIYVAIARTFLL